MFYSQEKEKFVVGEEYYTYYMDVTNKGNRIIDYTGIMKVRVKSNEPSQYSPEGYTEFIILESGKLSNTMEHNIHVYMNGYGLAFTKFFSNKDECIKEHDNYILKLSKNQSTSDKEKMLKKIINKTSLPKKDEKEVKALSWYNTLTKQEKENVKWIKYFWDDI